MPVALLGLSDLLGAARRRALHLELRDVYAGSAAYAAWLAAGPPYDRAAADAHLSAGERVRWLPRRLASRVPMPGNDFWLIDDHLLFNLFSGDGDWIDVELADDADTVALCDRAFETVWNLGTDHEHYRPG